MQTSGLNCVATFIGVFDIFGPWSDFGSDLGYILERFLQVPIKIGQSLFGIFIIHSTRNLSNST
jgi:hypothetical protein